MPYFFDDRINKGKDRAATVLGLDHSPLVGSGTCVDLVKTYSPGLAGKSTQTWIQGKKLTDLPSLIPGTVIATFENGRYPGRDGGNHAAFFVRASEVVNGKMTEIVVMDQFHTYGGTPRPWVATRKIRIQPKLKYLKNGNPDYSNDLNYFYVVE